MKILMVNKFYFIKGGSERYFFELSNILMEHGHKVIPFAMKHPNNYSSRYEKYFVDNIEFNLNSDLEKLKKSFKISGRIIYSLHARKKIEQLIEKTKPDIAHLHMIDHQLSPSILHVLKKHNIPVIQTVHQYKIICPNYLLYNTRTHKICEKCVGGHYYHPIFERCHKNSSMAGFILAVESYLHKAMKIYEGNINIFHVPSFFMKEKLEQGGIDKSKIEHLFYTIDINNYSPHFDSEDYFLYFGRLSEEKGLVTLLKAMQKVRNSKLLIIGDGPQRMELESFSLKSQLQNVKFLGAKYGKELKSIVARSKFVVVPSEWYDNSPLVIYESYALGKPVIGSDIGGIPELIEPGKTGLLFQPGNSEELVEKINFLLKHPQLVKEYGINARKKAGKEFSPEFHYHEMYRKYQRLLGIK